MSKKVCNGLMDDITIKVSELKRIIKADSSTKEQKAKARAKLQKLQDHFGTRLIQMNGHHVEK